MAATLPYTSNVPKTLHRLLKWLVCLALGGYVFLLAALLCLRYWVLPEIDRWRQPLQEQLSQAFGVPVQLGPLSASWSGHHLRVAARDVRLRDPAGRRLLDIPSIDAVLSWRSLLKGAPRLRSLHADGLELTVRRDSEGRVSLLGHSIEGLETPEASEDVQGPVLNWLSQQGPVVFSNASIRWIDAARGAPPLELDDVLLSLRKEGDAHVFALQARPPEALGKQFALHGRVTLSSALTGLLAPQQVSGLFHISVDDMHPSAWSPWLDVHSVLEQGEVDWHGWQEVVAGELGRHVSRVTVEDGIWKTDEARVSATSAMMYVSGHWSAIEALWADDAPVPTAGDAGLRVALRLAGLEVEVPGVFDAALAWDDVAVSMDVRRDSEAGFSLAVDRAQLRNADMDLDVRGRWQERGAGPAGLIDVEGRFLRAELAAIVRYLPGEVDADARDWMRSGLLAGRLLDAPVRLAGDLAEFPFGDRPESGDFDVGGPVHGVVIDYAPATRIGEPGWPRLERLDGHARLHRVDLTVKADSMQMRPGGQPIELRDVHARIQNIENGSVLETSGVGRAHAEAFLALIRHSPLNRLLDGVFNDARGDGQWEVPISLRIPLFDVDSSTVEGAVVFDRGALQLAGAYPVLSELQGRASFTDEAVRIEGVKGRGLGGPVTITGGMGKGQKGIVFEGSLRADALNDYLEGRLGSMVAGSTSYRLALLRNAAGAYGVRLDAPLEGLSIDLPPPLSKPPSERVPLSVQWTPAATAKESAALDIKLGKALLARFLRRPATAKGGPFFHSGAVSLDGTARIAGPGLVVDVAVPGIDLDAWRDLLTSSAVQAGDGNASPLFPPLRDLRVQATRARLFGNDLDQFTFTARRPEGARWRLDISSTQTAGTLYWQERQGRIQGDVEAHFERLEIGGPADGDTSASGKPDTEQGGTGGESSLDEEIDIPAIRLTVDRLRVHGYDIGRVSVKGVNEERGKAWKLESLEVTSPHGELKGSGLWRLQGDRRGLRIQANAVFGSLGDYLDQAGIRNIMQGGQGEIKGYVEWRDIPWRFERSALYGEVAVDLARGRLSSVGSRAARLLELLSLQSVKRLANMEWRPGAVMKEGFAFDTLQGNVRLNAGILHSENYRVAGPAGTIAIAGDVDLPQEKLDLYAVVVPNLDVSGAAIAAGIAVNPIVGLGAFLTQWLLKDPLGKAMAAEYRIRGGFDDPQISAVNTSEKKR